MGERIGPLLLWVLFQGDTIMTAPVFNPENPPGLWTGSKTQCLTSGLTDPFPVPLKVISRNNILKINF